MLFTLDKQKLIQRKLRDVLAKGGRLSRGFLSIAKCCYFGKHSFGVQAASNTYYGKDLNELNLAQMAMLAGIPRRQKRETRSAVPSELNEEET